MAKVMLNFGKDLKKYPICPRVFHYLYLSFHVWSCFMFVVLNIISCILKCYLKKFLVLNAI